MAWPPGSAGMSSPPWSATPTPTAAARQLAAAIAAPVRLPSEVAVSVTASIGLAPASPAGLAATLADADAAMYRAKTTRTGVAVFDRHRDDHATADTRPTVRVRDLAVAEVGR